MTKDIDIKQLPAFPVNMSGPCTFAGIDIPEGAKVEWGGMALRDYFAAKAIPAVMKKWDNGNPDGWKGIARECYRMADAMLEARK